MRTNVEIKAKVENSEALIDRIETLCDTPAEMITQEDTFFHTPKGRLKLRVVDSGQSQLIYYDRKDTLGPKISRYKIATVSDPVLMKSALTTALGIRGVVKKERRLYFIGNTRIHLDCVEGLGNFLEIEVVLAERQAMEDGRTRAADLMKQLEIREEDLRPGAQAHI